MNRFPACFSVLLLPALLLAGCRGQPVLGDGGDGADERAASVAVVSPERVEVTRTSTQPATVHAFYEAHIHAKVAGYVETLNVDIGQAVADQEVLAKLSVPEMAKQREAKLATIRRLEAEQTRAAAQQRVAAASVDAYAAMVDQAEAEVAKADANLTASGVEQQRVSDLVDQKAVADRLLDEANRKQDAAAAEKAAASAGVTSAKAQLALAKAKLEASDADIQVAASLTDVARRELDELDELIKYATLKAPFDGVVTARHIDIGDLVRNAQNGANQGNLPLLTVAKIDKVRVRVPLPERDAPLADIGDVVHLQLQALPGQKFTGKISRIAKALDPQTRTMNIEVDLDNPDGKLLPGMFGQATVDLESTAEQIVLPANVVRYDEQGRSYVYVVDASNQVQVVDVATGRDDGEQIQITSGLTGDERIIGPSLHRFKEGQVVTVR